MDRHFTPGEGLRGRPKLTLALDYQTQARHGATSLCQIGRAASHTFRDLEKLFCRAAPVPAAEDLEHWTITRTHIQRP